jgi:hypothetical protein
MSSLDIQYDSFRPKVCAFYAGRAWYSGVPSGSKLGWVMFSQVLTDISNATRCYQQNDPTSEAFSDLLDSDGGVIQIPEAGEIVGLTALGPVLLVFASNGVWQIGGSGGGFSASAYSVEKATNIGCLFQKSIVVSEDSAYYWGNSGIYQLTIDSEGRARVADISEQKIKTFYQSIPAINKLYVDGKYNNSEKVVYWAYNGNTIEDTSSGAYKKNKFLCYNTQLSAFYTLSIDNTAGPVVTAIAVTKETVESDIEFDVVVGAAEVVVGANQVIADINVLQGAVKQLKCLTYAPVGVNFASVWSDFIRTSTNDWDKTFVGVDVDSYVVTGYNVGGVGPARSKTAQYVSVFAKRTEDGFDEQEQPTNPSSILMQTRWDFTDNTHPGKWSDDVEVYRPRRPFFVNFPTSYDDGYPLVITKNKVRGRGKALQIKFAAGEGKQMHLMGWSIGFVNNTTV